MLRQGEDGCLTGSGALEHCVSSEGGIKNPVGICGFDFNA